MLSLPPPITPSLQVIARGHKPGVTAKHTCCAGNTWYVDLEEEEIKRTLGVSVERDSVTCEVPFGGVLFLNNSLPHRSLENYSDKVRWSLDLRWQHPDKSNGFYVSFFSVLMCLAAVRILLHLITLSQCANLRYTQRSLIDSQHCTHSSTPRV